MANDKFFLAKKTDSTLTAAQVEKLEQIAKLSAAANVADSSDALANALKDIIINMGLMVKD